jgi:hypothetical protein
VGAPFTLPGPCAAAVGGRAAATLYPVTVRRHGWLPTNCRVCLRAAADRPRALARPQPYTPVLHFEPSRPRPQPCVPVLRRGTAVSRHPLRTGAPLGTLIFFPFFLKKNCNTLQNVDKTNIS